MSARRAVCTTAVCGHTKKRKSVTLEVIRCVKEIYRRTANCGHSKSSLFAAYNYTNNPWGNAEKIKLCAQNVTPLAATKLTRNRSGIMENMERLLNIWMEDQHQRDSPCSLLSR